MRFYRPINPPVRSCPLMFDEADWVVITLAVPFWSGILLWLIGNAIVN